MKKIDEMIKQLCPNGVEKVKLNTLLDYEQPSPYIVKSTEYSNEYETPVLTAGASFCLGYTNETDGIYKANEENPVIIFDDFTTSFHWVEFDFKVKSSAIKMLRPKKNNVSFRYIYFCMCCIDYIPVEHSRQWIGRYSNFEIPLPPPSIQKEIVSVLDKFSELIEKTDEEIALRQKQYEYYREKLLTFEDGEVEWKKLGEVCEIKNGKDYKHLSSGNIPVWGTGGIMTYVDTYAYNKPSVLLPRKGTISKVYYTEHPFWTVDTLFYTIINIELIQPRYLYDYMSTINLEKYNTSVGNRPSLTQSVLNDIEIPIPSPSRQQSIVATLDKFETLISKLKEERELRQKQYEYYREKLLTF